MKNNLNTESQNPRHPERSEGSPRTSTETLHSLRSFRVTGASHPESQSHRHPELSLRHPEQSEGSQETRSTHINIGTGEDISIRELTDPSKLHALGWKHKVELADGIKTMSEWYLNNQGVK